MQKNKVGDTSEKNYHNGHYRDTNIHAKKCVRMCENEETD